MEFQTKHNRKRQPREENHGEILVETAGYLPAKKRIENLMFAGLQLKEFRMEQFDFYDNQVDEDYFDRTRSKNFDIADLSEMRRDLEQRSKEKIKQRLAAEQAAKKAEKLDKPDDKNPD